MDSARGQETADGRRWPFGLLRNVPPPSERWPRASGGPERTGKGAETTQLAPRMNRPARTLARDLVRRRHPTGASPSRRNAPGRTLSPMPSEQKGAYGGHLAPYVRILWRTCVGSSGIRDDPRRVHGRVHVRILSMNERKARH